MFDGICFCSTDKKTLLKTHLDILLKAIECAVVLTTFNPQRVKTPTFSGTHVLRGVKIGNFPATLWKREKN